MHIKNAEKTKERKKEASMSDHFSKSAVNTVPLVKAWNISAVVSYSIYLHINGTHAACIVIRE